MANRPSTPEMPCAVFPDKTPCKLLRNVHVRVLPRSGVKLDRQTYCFDLENIHELPEGHLVTVFNARPLNFAGENAPLSAENYGYRIKSDIALTVYKVIGNAISYSEEVINHSNLRSVRPECSDSHGFEDGTIVALKRQANFKNSTTRFLPEGTLLMITSGGAKTPRGQNWPSRTPVNEKTFYNALKIVESEDLFSVGNTSQDLVRHQYLERA